MMNAKNYATSVEKKISFIFALVDLNRKMEEDNVFVRKAKTTNLMVLPGATVFFKLKVVFIQK